VPGALNSKGMIQPRCASVPKQQKGSRLGGGRKKKTSEKNTGCSVWHSIDIVETVRITATEGDQRKKPNRVRHLGGGGKKCVAGKARGVFGDALEAAQKQRTGLRQGGKENNSLRRPR